MDLNYKAIGERIRSSRMQGKISQEQLANLANLTPAHISHIENGHTKLSLPALISIANALGTTADALLYDNVQASYDAFDKDFKDLVDDCTTHEKMIILENARSLKAALRSRKI